MSCFILFVLLGEYELYIIFYSFMENRKDLKYLFVIFLVDVDNEIFLMLIDFLGYNCYLMNGYWVEFIYFLI